MLLKNKKAYSDYEILDTYETGIVLKGYEVKTLRSKQGNLKGSHVSIKENAPWIVNFNIPRYQYTSFEIDTKREKKLLMSKKEIEKLDVAQNQKGITIIPLEVYLKGKHVKVKVGVCRGKKKHDKRHDLKKRAQDMEIKRAIKDR